MDQGQLQMDAWSYHFYSSVLFSPSRPPVASLCPSTVTPLANDAAFHCNDIPPLQRERGEIAMTLSQVPCMKKELCENVKGKRPTHK